MALVKLEIDAYGEANCTGQSVGSITAMFNPESYTRSYTVSYEMSDEIASSAATMIFRRIGQSDLNLKLIVDGTGIVPLPGATSVDAYITNFLSVVYNYQGSSHRPNYLKLTWGSLSVVCVCTSVNVAYSLFNQDGTALRATLNVIFAGTVDFKTKAQEAQKSSPDLTHVRTVKAGDTLPLMTYQIYGDSSYYLQVARANNLTSVSAIKPGDQIYFPPIKK
ncbi:LysM peptidoglycan-binding domain-containing protein [Mucilaginibacter robiniae]|uniref:LysM peptidoglycan-binding domain-containing protein n=1 Tax=Mucilaginibacter robiniae TaxID=2728022 RepID=A0A7L5E3H4_9SPHI|nr:LysM peptidoglycan-binding domain-containing protein [Mucilaginibacter robiniae]QJD96204.1 LysM peptidoglycan-binding domain-containing protein [Mucilaginibacter robiniae]